MPAFERTCVESESQASGISLYLTEIKRFILILFWEAAFERTGELSNPFKQRNEHIKSITFVFPSLTE